MNEPMTTSMGSTGEAPSQRWLRRSASQIRYRLPTAVSAAHSQSKALGRVRGERALNGNATKTSGIRNSRCTERCSRGSSVP